MAHLANWPENELPKITQLFRTRIEMRLWVYSSAQVYTPFKNRIDFTLKGAQSCSTKEVKGIFSSIALLCLQNAE